MQEPLFWPCACENRRPEAQSSPLSDHTRAKATAEPSRQSAEDHRGQGSDRLSRALRYVARPCDACCPDASHRGPVLGGEGKEGKYYATHSVIEIDSTGRYGPLRGTVSGQTAPGKGAPISGTPPASIAEPEVLHNRPSYEEAIDQRPWAMGQGPLRAGPGKSSAKRICSFQLRRYLVTWYSCTPGSTARPSIAGPVVGLRARCSRRKEKARKQPSVPF